MGVAPDFSAQVLCGANHYIVDELINRSAAYYFICDEKIDNDRQGRHPPECKTSSHLLSTSGKIDVGLSDLASL